MLTKEIIILLNLGSSPVRLNCYLKVKFAPDEVRYEASLVSANLP